MKDNTPLAPRATPRLNYDQKLLLVVYLLRRPAFLAEAATQLEAAHWAGPDEAALGALYAAAVGLRREYPNAVPPRPILQAEALSELDRRHRPVERLRQELREAVEAAYAPELTDDDLPPAWGYRLLRRFLEERSIGDELRALLAAPGPAGTLDDVHGVLKHYAERASRLFSLEAQRPTGLWEIPDDTPVRPTLSTGLRWLDEFMDGGRKPGEAYGVLGTIGSGKTRLCTMLAANAATQQEADAATMGRPPGLVVYAAYETPAHDIRRRIISYAARIPQSRLPGDYRQWRRHLSSAARPESLQPYERSLPRPPGVPPVGELERFEAVERGLSRIHVLELNGPAHDPGAGCGGVEELAGKVEKIVQATGTALDTLVVDFVWEAANRYLSARNANLDREMRHYINGYGMAIKRAFCNQYDATCWLAHQLNGQANGKSASAKLSPADAAEAKLFHVNLDFTVQIGNKSEENGCLQANPGKTRRMAGIHPTPTILKLRQEYDDLYRTDEFVLLRGKIRSREAAQLVAGGTSEAGEVDVRGGL